ncbi:MAG: hypothetical protein BWY09_02395 [Candidatus Hydrogenedentes bacterium ADurb.Bin179]|nr:MAG: hypothetical protein BWY09_02395 [Candidatus Hydrogenedentes bacterium ADurb.Bin179]
MPNMDDLLQHIKERRHAVPAKGRKIGAAVKGLQVWRQENTQRPSPVSRHRGHGIHIDIIQVGTFLPVHLDVDKMVVHKGSEHFILKGLPLHDMTPVTGRITDGKKNRLVLIPGQCKRLFIPRMPVHGIAGMLQEVGTGFTGKAVHPLAAGLVGKGFFRG